MVMAMCIGTDVVSFGLSKASPIQMGGRQVHIEERRGGSSSTLRGGGSKCLKLLPAFVASHSCICSNIVGAVLIRNNGKRQRRRSFWGSEKLIN